MSKDKRPRAPVIVTITVDHAVPIDLKESVGEVFFPTVRQLILDPAELEKLMGYKPFWTDEDGDELHYDYDAKSGVLGQDGNEEETIMFLVQALERGLKGNKKEEKSRFGYWLSKDSPIPSTATWEGKNVPFHVFDGKEFGESDHRLMVATLPIVDQVDVVPVRVVLENGDEVEYAMWSIRRYNGRFNDIINKSEIYMAKEAGKEPLPEAPEEVATIQLGWWVESTKAVTKVTSEDGKNIPFRVLIPIKDDPRPEVNLVLFELPDAYTGNVAMINEDGTEEVEHGVGWVLEGMAAAQERVKYFDNPAPVVTAGEGEVSTW